MYKKIILLMASVFLFLSVSPAYAVKGAMTIDILLPDVDMDIPKGKKAGENDIAVVIGNRNYAAKGVPSVDFAIRDARGMKKYLLKTFGYSEENIIYVEDASFAKFNEIFGSEKDHQGRLYNYIKKNESNVFVYYAGHGSPDLKSTEAYFVPVDADPQYISINGYSLQTFYNNLSKMQAKSMTIVIDACFSGNSENGMILRNISPAMVKIKKEYDKPSNALLITSADMDQVSAWYPNKKHSLFTYYFLKGLQGAADLNNDKDILAWEMKEYLSDKVPYMARRLNGVEQKPVVVGSDDTLIVSLVK